MAPDRYGMLAARAVQTRREDGTQTPHLQVHLGVRDDVFGFAPANGVHDIHSNQCHPIDATPRRPGPATAAA